MHGEVHPTKETGLNVALTGAPPPPTPHKGLDGSNQIWLQIWLPQICQRAQTWFQDAQQVLATCHDGAEREVT
jgi:hypothetical protein